MLYIPSIVLGVVVAAAGLCIHVSTPDLNWAARWV
jgi:hypothetical protein